MRLKRKRVGAKGSLLENNVKLTCSLLLLQAATGKEAMIQLM